MIINTIERELRGITVIKAANRDLLFIRKDGKELELSFEDLKNLNFLLSIEIENSFREKDEWEGRCESCDKEYHFCICGGK